jgi:hypothetical protein
MDRYARDQTADGAGSSSAAKCWATFEAVIKRRIEPTGPQSAFAKFLRHTITLQPGRTRRNAGRLERSLLVGRLRHRDAARAANPNKRNTDDEEVRQRRATKANGEFHNEILSTLIAWAT